MQHEQHHPTLQIHLIFASGSRPAMVFGLHIRLLFLATRNVRIQCVAARQL